jgi:hypothetical protein
MPEPFPAISELCSNDERYWKIDWLGAVYQDEKTPLEPKIEVIVSPLKPDAKQPFKEDQLAGEDRKIVGVGVGQLPFLRVGSIWQRGLPLHDEAGQSLYLPYTEISATTVTTIDSGQKTADGDYVIPKAVCKLGNSGLGAKCLAIHYNGNPYGIVIPIAEVIRFYYAITTRLAEASFQGLFKYALNDVIHDEGSGIRREDGIPILKLRKNFSNDDAWTIARILCDDAAYRGATLIFDSLAQAHLNNRRAYPRCGFPFVGTTNWEARGLCRKTRDEKWRYIIYELMFCTSPFPFTDVAILRDNRNENGEQDIIPDEEKTTAWPNAKPRTRVKPHDSKLQSSESPESGFPPIRIEQANERFGAIYGKKVTELPNDYNKSKHAPVDKFPTKEADSLSTSPGTNSSSTAAEAEIVSEHYRSKGLPASLEFIPEVVKILNRYDGIKADLMDQGGEIFVPLLPYLSKKGLWAYVNPRLKIRRRVAAISIAYVSSQHAYFVEIEPTPAKTKAGKNKQNRAGLVSYIGGTPMPDDVFQKVLWNIASNEGVWRKEELARLGINCTVMNHSWESAEHCVRNILERLHV